MAYLASPSGPFSDDEYMPVFESTAADMGGPAGPLFKGITPPELSIISPGLEPAAKPVVKSGVPRQASGDDKVSVYLRIRPLTAGEKERGEDQGCVHVQSPDTVILRAPKDSQNMKSAERGVTQSVHKFTFTQISGPDTSQQDFYDGTMKEMVRDVLHGENRLLFTYGVTNSGKTYTIQGVGREAGLLPRALVSVFRRLQGRLYAPMDLKPVLFQDVRQLPPGEVRVEALRKDSLLREEECSRLRGGGGAGSSTWDSGVGGLSATSHIASQMEDADSVCLDPDGLSLSGGVEDLEQDALFSVWVSFYEIYNEFLYDLLEAPPTPQLGKRATLRLSDDKHGNPYVKDLTWIQVSSADEAWKVLGAGRKNQSFASTHLNHNSSRSHSIFSLRLLHILPEGGRSQVTRISELSVCDLAGSERCKEQRNGERMKEANNINTSLHTLGRCIAALRHNQQHSRMRPPQVVPFRDSKLTRVLQGFFCGRGRSSMVVNINPCTSTYDETLQALKFSAIATQLVHGPSTKTRVAYILSLLRQSAPGSENNNNSTLMEEEEEESDEEGDITMFDSEALLRAIDVLKGEVQRQREEKEALEASVREQVVSEMMEVIARMENDFSETLETERALMEERFEDKIGNLKKNLRKYYSQELEERDEIIRSLNAGLPEDRRGSQSQLAAPALPLFPPLGLEGEGPRRSQRLAGTLATRPVNAELEECRMELLAKSQELKQLKVQLSLPGAPGTLTQAADRKLEEGQRNLRQLRTDLQRLGQDLQSGERACCRNTDGERLRQTLASADDTLAKQDQALVDLQNLLQLVKGELRRTAETLAQLQLPSSAPAPPATPGSSCKKRGCAAGGAGGGAAATTPANAENQPPEKRTFFRAVFPARTPARKPGRDNTATPYAQVLRSRQVTPPPSPRLAYRKY